MFAVTLAGRTEMRHESQIDTFVDHFHEFVRHAVGLPDELHLNTLKKLGFVAAIDALAKVWAAKEPKVRPRFVCFIKKFSGWADGERMSLPHLVEALSRDSRPEFQQLKEWSLHSLQTWRPRGGPRSPWPIERDPKPGEVLRLWPEGEEIKVSKKRTLAHEKFFHFNLLYSRRNSLAHELRTDVWEASERDSQFPYYKQTPIDGHEKWLLHYPVGFLSTLAGTCLKKLEEWLKENDINPYDHYRIGEFMLEELIEVEETANPAPAADV